MISQCTQQLIIHKSSDISLGELKLNNVLDQMSSKIEVHILKIVHYDTGKDFNSLWPSDLA